MFTPERVHDFFDYARERQRIYLKRKHGEKGPWTNDPIFQVFKFTNVFREDDRTTVWFRQNIRERMKDSNNVLFATVAFRWFNRVETGVKLLPTGVFEHHDKWNRHAVLAKLHSTQPPYVTGAYIIKTPDGFSKEEGVVRCIDMFQDRLQRMGMPRFTSLQQAHTWLCQSPYLGPFMAYEVVTDLRYTHMLRDAIDINTWANPGPGAARGICRLMNVPLTALARNSKRDAETLQKGMRQLLAFSRLPDFWDPSWPDWEMREVEHTLCEFDKYERVRTKEGTPRSKFSMTGPLLDREGEEALEKFHG